MIKEEKTYFSKVLALIVIILLFNVGFLLYKFGDWEGQISGMVVKENFGSTYEQISNSIKIVLLSLWSGFILLLGFTFVKDKGVLKRRKELQGIDLAQMNRECKSKSKGCKTDLDVVYTILQKKSELRISTISKLFNINKKTALGWAKILESGKLAKIEYPGFGEPILKSKEDKKEKQEELKKSEIKTIKGKKIDQKEIKKTNWASVILLSIGIGGGTSLLIYIFREQLITYINYIFKF